MITEGRSGFCGVRQNIAGKLYALTYAKASSVAVDPIEKKPMFHFYPGSLAYSLGSIGCNFRCKHCQNWQIAHAIAIDYFKELVRVPPEETVENALRNGCLSITLTYNEPTIWIEYALDLFPLAKEKGLLTGFVTNGFITRQALDMLSPYMDAYRVDVKAFRKESYKKIVGIYDFSPVLDAAAWAFHDYKMHVEIVTLVIPGVNDSDDELRGIAKWIRDSLSAKTPWHVTRFYPYLHFRDVPPTPIETLERAREIGFEEGLKFVYIGNVPGHEGENTYCPNCKKLVIGRNGYQITAMHQTNGKCDYCGEDLNIRS